MKKQNVTKLNPERLGAFRVAAKTYEIFVVEELPESRAVTDAKSGTILLTEACEDEMRDQLMHECLHAIFDAYGIVHGIDSETEESIVRRLAPALLASFDIKLPVTRLTYEQRHGKKTR
jgi:hypothetical protein